MKLTLTHLALLSAISLTACGGGGGGDGGSNSAHPSSAPVNGVTSPVTASNNVFKKVYDDGAYTLWGYYYLLNGVEQVAIGRNRISSSNTIIKTQAIYGATTSTETLPVLFPQIGPFDAIYQDSVNISGTTLQFVFGADPTSAELSVPGHASVAKWKATIAENDVAGQLVANHIKTDAGALVNGSYRIPGQVFSAGAKSYITTLEASVDMLFQYGREAFITSEAALTNSSRCNSITGLAPKLITEILANGAVRFFETTTGTCTRTGEVLIASDGAWSKRTVGANTFYDITYPASVTGGKFSSLFTGAIGPSTKATNVYINRPSGSTNFYGAQLVKQGERFVSRQPHFNTMALNDLRALAGI